MTAELTETVAGSALAALPAVPTREQITRLQSAMLPTQIALPEPGHHFAPGLYLRTLLVPAGQVIVGKIHKHAHFLFVLKGRAVVVSEFGRMEVEAGHFSVSPAGVKRVVLAMEDTLFATVHVNKDDGQDLEAIEAEHIEPEALVPLAHDLREVIP